MTQLPSQKTGQKESKFGVAKCSALFPMDDFDGKGK
jgi:hypothetical protein